MPKSVRRLTFRRTTTFDYAADFPNYAHETDANALVAANLPGGINTIGELLAGSPAALGVTTKGAWGIQVAGNRVEPFSIFAPTLAMSVGQRVSASSPQNNLLFVVRTVTGDFKTGATEPTWPTTVGSTVVSGNVTFMAIAKFTAPVARVNSTTYSVGQILKYAITGTTREYLVVTSTGANAASPPTFTGASGLVGATVTDNLQTLLCIAGGRTYTTQTLLSYGEIIRPADGSTEEWLVTVAGKTDDTAAPTGGTIEVTTAVRGGATLLRVA